MKFRRKSAEAEPTAEAASVAAPEEVSDEAPEDGQSSRTDGPWDIDELPADDDVARLDLGALLIAPPDDLEVRIQVDEQTNEVQSVLLAGSDGAVELRVFAAPRHGDLWSDLRPRIAADYAQRGGTADERAGRFGPELVCQLTVQMPDGRTGTQPSRILGINGPRWMLRATMLGRPAQEPEVYATWDDLVERVVVRRGKQPMPVGAELTLTFPRDGHVVERPAT